MLRPENLTQPFLPKWVPRYLSDSVRQLIRRHAVGAGDGWTAARAFLSNCTPQPTEILLSPATNFEPWSRNMLRKAFSRIQDIDTKYYRKFITQTDYLLSRFEILQREANVLFYQGIPDDFRKKFCKRIPYINQKTSNPPYINMMH